MAFNLNKHKKDRDAPLAMRREAMSQAAGQRQHRRSSVNMQYWPESPANEISGVSQRINSAFQRHFQVLLGEESLRFKPGMYEVGLPERPSESGEPVSDIVFKFNFRRRILPINDEKAMGRVETAVQSVDNLLASGPGGSLETFTGHLESHGVPLMQYFGSAGDKYGGRAAAEFADDQRAKIENNGPDIRLPDGNMFPGLAANHWRDTAEMDIVPTYASHSHETAIHRDEIDGIRVGGQLLKAIADRARYGFGIDDNEVHVVLEQQRESHIQQRQLNLENPDDRGDIHQIATYYQNIEQNILKLAGYAFQRKDLPGNEAKTVRRDQWSWGVFSDDGKSYTWIGLPRDIDKQADKRSPETQKLDLPMVTYVELQTFLKSMIRPLFGSYSEKDMEDVRDYFLVPGFTVSVFPNGFDPIPSRPDERMPVLPSMRRVPVPSGPEWNKEGRGNMHNALLPDAQSGNMGRLHLVRGWKDSLAPIVEHYGPMCDEWLKFLTQNQGNLRELDPVAADAISTILNNRTNADTVRDVLDRYYDTDYELFRDFHMGQSTAGQAEISSSLAKHWAEIRDGKAYDFPKFLVQDDGEDIGDADTISSLQAGQYEGWDTARYIGDMVGILQEVLNETIESDKTLAAIEKQIAQTQTALAPIEKQVKNRTNVDAVIRQELRKLRDQMADLVSKRDTRQDQLTAPFSHDLYKMALHAMDGYMQHGFGLASPEDYFPSDSWEQLHRCMQRMSGLKAFGKSVARYVNVRTSKSAQRAGGSDDFEVSTSGMIPPLSSSEQRTMMDENGFELFKKYGYQVAKIMDIVQALTVRSTVTDHYVDGNWLEFYGQDLGISSGGDGQIYLGVKYAFRTSNFLDYVRQDGTQDADAIKLKEQVIREEMEKQGIDPESNPVPYSALYQRGQPVDPSLVSQDGCFRVLENVEYFVGMFRSGHHCHTGQAYAEFQHAWADFHRKYGHMLKDLQLSIEPFNADLRQLRAKVKEAIDIARQRIESSAQIGIDVIFTDENQQDTLLSGAAHDDESSQAQAESEHLRQTQQPTAPAEPVEPPVAEETTGPAIEQVSPQPVEQPPDPGMPGEEQERRGSLQSQLVHIADQMDRRNERSIANKIDRLLSEMRHV